MTVREVIDAIFFRCSANLTLDNKISIFFWVFKVCLTINLLIFFIFGFEQLINIKTEKKFLFLALNETKTILC